MPAQDFGHYEELADRKEEAEKQAKREWKERQKEAKRKAREDKKNGVVKKPENKGKLKPGEIRTASSGRKQPKVTTGLGNRQGFSFSGQVKPPEAKFKKAVSTKVKVREPEGDEVVVTAAPVENKAPEPKKQTFSDILKEQEAKRQAENSEAQDEAPVEPEASSGSYEDIRRRMMEKKDKGEDFSVKHSKKPVNFTKVAIGVIVALALAALFYALS